MGAYVPAEPTFVTVRVTVWMPASSTDADRRQVEVARVDRASSGDRNSPAPQRKAT